MAAMIMIVRRRRAFSVRRGEAFDGLEMPEILRCPGTNVGNHHHGHHHGHHRDNHSDHNDHDHHDGGGHNHRGRANDEQEVPGQLPAVWWQDLDRGDLLHRRLGVHLRQRPLLAVPTLHGVPGDVKGRNRALRTTTTVPLDCTAPGTEFAKLYRQCGGRSWTGARCCEPGTICAQACSA